MAITTINIPKTNVTIICRNKREKFAAGCIVNSMYLAADAAVDGYAWALDAVSGRDGDAILSDTVTEIKNRLSVFYFMDALEPDAPVSVGDIVDALAALYEDAKKARDAVDDTAAAEDAAADMYMDAVKADAAYCLGIDEGSDEWYELMSI